MKVLIVDDHRFNRNLLMKRCERLGHQVQCAANGREAIDLAIEEEFDLILMDLRMPEVDGYQATKEIKNSEKSKSVPIIAISANTSKDEIEKALKCGCERFLTKPIMKYQLVEILEEFGSLHLTGE